MNDITLVEDLEDLEDEVWEDKEDLEEALLLELSDEESDVLELLEDRELLELFELLEEPEVPELADFFEEPEVPEDREESEVLLEDSESDSELDLNQIRNEILTHTYSVGFEIEGFLNSGSDSEVLISDDVGASPPFGKRLISSIIRLDDTPLISHWYYYLRRQSCVLDHYIPLKKRFQRSSKNLLKK